MLVWSSTARRIIWAVAALLFAVIYGLPASMIVLASIAGQWNGILPGGLTLIHLPTR